MREQKWFLAGNLLMSLRNQSAPGGLRELSTGHPHGRQLSARPLLLYPDRLLEFVSHGDIFGPWPL